MGKIDTNGMCEDCFILLGKGEKKLCEKCLLAMVRFFKILIASDVRVNEKGKLIQTKKIN